MSRASRGRRCQPGQLGAARRSAAAAAAFIGARAEEASSVPERERFEAARPLRIAVAGLDLDAGQAQAVVGVGAVGGERPRRQARQALLGGDRPARRPVEPELLARRRAGVAADQLGAGLERLRRLLPGDQLERVAAPVGANALDLAAFAAPRLASARRPTGRAAGSAGASTSTRG